MLTLLSYTISQVLKYPKNDLLCNIFWQLRLHLDNDKNLLWKYQHYIKKLLFS